MTPIFIFSLPRSGSTLVQRVLAAHEEISTVSEPWILLPLLYALKERGVYAEYGHVHQVAALRDFCAELPRKEAEYFSELRAFVLALYKKASKKRGKYFLDKTPRYHLVAQEILDLFPEGKHIFLWRNPLAVIASTMQTWGKGKWNLFVWKVDLFGGIENLVSVIEHRRQQVCSIRYEDLVGEGADDGLSAWRQIFAYLGLPFDPMVLSKFKEVKLAGRMGDATGINEYATISPIPINSWKNVLHNPLRKAWCRRYLRWLGEERLAIMGYDLKELLEELDAVPLQTRGLLSDGVRMGLGAGYCWLEPYLMRDKFALFAQGRRLYVHR